MIVLRDGGVRKGGIQEEQRVGIFALNGGSNSAEMLHHELRQEVAELRRLRLVRGGVVLHRLGPADVVDADDERLHICVFRDRVNIQADEPQSNQGEENERDLEIRVHHER